MGVEEFATARLTFSCACAPPSSCALDLKSWWDEREQNGECGVHREPGFKNMRNSGREPKTIMRRGLEGHKIQTCALAFWTYTWGN